MAETALWPLQKSIYQRLSTNAELAAMVTGVFDYVPKDQPYPYITIGEPIADPFDTKTTLGEQIAIVIHTWSQYDGKKESYDLLNKSLQITSRKLQLDDGFKIDLQERTGMQVFDDIDGRTYHGVLRLRFTINREV